MREIPNLFISYRRKPSKWLASFLEHILRVDHNRDVFIDIRDIGVGDWLEVIKDAIRTGEYFLLLLAPDSFENLDPDAPESDRAFLVEIETAIDSKRHIIPLVHDDFDWDMIPEYLQGIIPRRNAIEIAYGYNAIYNIAQQINDWTLEYLESVPKIQINFNSTSQIISSLPEDDYKEKVENYFEEDYCTICDPKNPFANFIEWSPYDRQVIDGEEFINKIGYCNFCTATTIECDRCGTITTLFDGKNKCEGGCGIEFVEMSNRDGGLDISAVEVEIE